MVPLPQYRDSYMKRELGCWKPVTMKRTFVPRQAKYKVHTVFPCRPIHELPAAEMPVSPHDEPGLFPMLAHHPYQAAEDAKNVGRFVTASGTQQGQDHFPGDALEDEQGHVRVPVVIIVEKCPLLVVVGVEVTVVAVKDDTFGLFVIRGDKFLISII